MNEQAAYPIGTPGKAWGEAERAEWLARQQVRRSYAEQVLSAFDQLESHYERIQYGALSHDPERYPLFAFRTRAWDASRPAVLITGGVHGYETSGVHGAIRFLQRRGPGYESHFNLVAAPCISPWGYETINRWNPGAVDPNRSFHPDTPSEEAGQVMQFVEKLGIQFLVHFDLHETTDSDNNEFRPALAARDGIKHDNWHIPDGFYTVDHASRPQPGFQGAVIASVEKVTHIAEAAADGCIIGEPLQQHGVIEYDADRLYLCMGMTDAPYVTTTEVYPDSPRVDDEICARAQVAAVCGGLDHLRSASRLSN
ncbi:MAG: M14 family metallocarboxypeptidase [Xanthomonadales bacterium]|nr:M14 family metallocarboxypeptidase [Xanthomonadales bacterium]